MSLGIGSRVFHNASNSVDCTREIGSAFDGCVCRSDQHEQEAYDANDDEEFQERKARIAAATLSSGQNSDGRSRRAQMMTSKPSRQYQLRGARPLHVHAPPPGSGEGKHLGERSINANEPAGKLYS